MKKDGFTLLELLVVIVVIGILATLVVGGANYALRVARAKRVSLSCNVLQTAIHRFHTEYNEWPGGGTPNSNHQVVFTGEGNKAVFGPLRVDSKDNPDGIVFLDETAFFTPDNDDGATKLSETTGAKPLVFVSRSGRWTKKNGDYLYYKVVINYEYDSVSVTSPGFDDEDDD